MDLQDRLTRGIVSGVLAGIILDVLDVLSFYLKIDELTYFDWAGIVVYGGKPHDLVGYMVAIFTQIFLSGLLGIVFAYLIPQVTSRNIILKGAVWGLTIWGISFISVYIFKLTKLMEADTLSAASDALTATIYGISLAIIFSKLGSSKKNM